jgi:hypothetical protein
MNNSWTTNRRRSRNTRNRQNGGNDPADTSRDEPCRNRKTVQIMNLAI